MILKIPCLLWTSVCKQPFQRAAIKRSIAKYWESKPTKSILNDAAEFPATPLKNEY